jgi:hypothetical protein
VEAAVGGLAVGSRGGFAAGVAGCGRGFAAGGRSCGGIRGGRGLRRLLAVVLAAQGGAVYTIPLIVSRDIHIFHLDNQKISKMHV